MTADQLFDQFVQGFAKRKFSAGLLISFMDLLDDLGVPDMHLKGFSDFLAKFPRRVEVRGGGRANTLIVEKGGGQTVSLRPYYNRIEEFFRETSKRYDYPSCAPHATQAWADPVYMTWWDALTTFDSAQLEQLRQRVTQHVLDALPDQAFDPSSVLREPPLFQLIITSFDLSTRRGETTGAAFQGLVFGFLRADNPHLQVEIDRVRTGSKRRDRVGDIDAWDGGRLALTAEVKQSSLGLDDVAQFGDFANTAGLHGAIGIVAALQFQDGVREAIKDLGLLPMDIDNILSVVELWDPAKQKVASSSMVYYFKHIERNSSLSKRMDDFLLEVTGKPVAAGAAGSTDG